MNISKIFTFILFLVALVRADEVGENPFVGKQGKVVEKTDWPGDFSKVVAVAYDFTQEDAETVVVGKRLHKGVFSVSSSLSKRQIKTLFSAVTGKHVPWKSPVCFEPHHGLVFYDESGDFVAGISICFSCRRYRVFPAGELSKHWDWDALAALFKELEVPFPENYTEAFETHEKQRR